MYKETGIDERATAKSPKNIKGIIKYSCLSLIKNWPRQQMIPPTKNAQAMLFARLWTGVTSLTYWSYFCLSTSTSKLLSTMGGTSLLHPETRALLERLLAMLRDEGEEKTFAFLRREVLQKR